MKETNFKQTELGFIPQDWEIAKLDKAISFLRTGLNPRNNFELNTYDASGYYVTVRELKGFDIAVDEKTDRVNDYALSCINERSKLNIGDVLFSGTGTIGQTALVQRKPYKWGIKEGIYAITTNSKMLNPTYLILFLHTPIAISLIDLYASGSTVKSIPMAKLKDMLIPLPPTLAEQCRIATALSDIDNLISSLDALIVKKQAIKQGAMQQLLTCKKRLQGFCSPWVEKKLGELGDTYNGLTGKTKEDFGRGTSQYVTFLNILCNPIIKENLFELVNVKPSEHQNKVKKGDLFFNTSSETPDEVGICSYSLTEIDNLYLNSFCFGFRLKDAQIDGLFLSYFFRSKIGRDLMITLAQGSTRYNLSKEQFLKSSIFIPSTKQEQSAIANILSDMDAEIENLQKKRNKYAAIKEGMMQQLLTGKIRLV